MKPKVYLETTIPSYLTSRPSRDLVTAAHQQVTRDWWERRRHDYDLFASQVVVQEARAGDQDAAERRLAALEGVPQLELREDVFALAEELMEKGAVPREAAEDALHIAAATVHGMEYLLTWNCTHIANAHTRFLIEEVCRSLGYRPPTICTPEELIEE